MASMTRREMLGKTSFAGMAAAGLVGCGTLTTLAHADEIAWDKECDFVEIGGGCGMTAAAWAAANGDQVIVLEKNDYLGGNTVLSGGILWLPMNGVDVNADLDSRELAMTYMKHLRGYEPIDDSVLEAFVDTNAELIQAVGSSTGLEVSPFSWFGDYHPNWEGGLDASRSVVFHPAGASDSDFANNAAVLVKTLAQAVTDNGGEVLIQTPAKHLIWRTQENGVPEVLGVVAEDVDGNEIKIKARKGVLLAAGGFGTNADWKNTFLVGPTPYTSGAPGQDGDGIKMAMELGCELRNMHSCWGHTAFEPLAIANTERVMAGGIPGAIHEFDHHKQGAILVNRHGVRFCNEASDYASQWRSNFAYENWGDDLYANIPSFFVCDSRMVNTLGLDPDGRQNNPIGEVPDYFTSGETLEELAANLMAAYPDDLTDPDFAEKLVATVERFNGFVDNECDEDFHRGENFLDWHMFTGAGGGFSDIQGPLSTLGKLEEGPFYGCKVVLIEIGTCGGCAINKDAQCIHVSGEPIPRLYAAGNNSGSPTGGYGGAGGTCGPAMTFSYLAAKHMHDLPAWE